MRKIALSLSLAAVTLAGAARAEVTAEQIPADFIQQFAPFALALIQQQFPDPPVKMELNPEKAVGYHVQEKVGVVVLPDKNLTAAVIDGATEQGVPVGVVATKSLSLEEKDQAIGLDRLAVADFNGTIKIPVFFLSVKGKGADRVLEVCCKKGETLVSVPLSKQAGDANTPLGIKLTNINLEKKKLDLKVSLGGSYESTLKLAFLDL